MFTRMSYPGASTERSLLHLVRTIADALGGGRLGPEEKSKTSVLVWTDGSSLPVVGTYSFLLVYVTWALWPGPYGPLLMLLKKMNFQ